MAMRRAAFPLSRKSRRSSSSYSLLQEQLPQSANPKHQEIEHDNVLEGEFGDKEIIDLLPGEKFENDCWSKMFPEILVDIIERVELSEDRWPIRKTVVSCACVCKRWRDVTKGIVISPLESGKITFPSSLKQSGPRNLPLQCFIKRNKKTSTFYLYLGLTSTLIDKGKFLLAARRFRRGGRIEYIISFNADDLSQGSNAYLGKLSSDFLGTKFTIYDSQPPHNGAKPSNSRSSRRFASKQISPQVPAGSYEIGQVSYKFNMLKSRGPRRMICNLQCLGTRRNIKEGLQKDDPRFLIQETPSEPMVLQNKAPRWHEPLQCWCLNFHGRVTVASVKNFQLVASLDPSQPEGKGDEDTVLLQFGKVGDDMFTMDYRYPLSAFQAFAICLTSFGTKLACE